MGMLLYYLYNYPTEGHTAVGISRILKYLYTYSTCIMYIHALRISCIANVVHVHMNIPRVGRVLHIYERISYLFTQHLDRHILLITCMHILYIYPAYEVYVFNFHTYKSTVAKTRAFPRCSRLTNFS